MRPRGDREITHHPARVSPSEGVVRDAREVLRKTRCLVRVGVGRSDGCHESNPSFHTITKLPSVCRVKAVFMMGIDKMYRESPEPQCQIEGFVGTHG